MNALFIVAIGIIALIWLLVTFFNDETIWDWFLGAPYQPRSTIPYDQSYVPPPPLPPRVRRNFGRHHNPISLEFDVVCKSDFEQLDDRTWQCPLCGLVRFEKTDVKPNSGLQAPGQ